MRFPDLDLAAGHSISSISGYAWNDGSILLITERLLDSCAM